MALRALSPLEDPTAAYVPQRPIAGRTTVGTRKDMGLFPGWSLLCCKTSKKMRKTCKTVLIIRLSKYVGKDKENYRVRWRTSCFIRPGESEDLAVQENSWRSHNSASEWFVYWAKDRDKISVCSQLSKRRQNMQQQFRSNRTDLMTDTMWSSGPITMTWEAVAPVSSANAGR